MPTDDDDLFDTIGPPNDIEDLDGETRGLLDQLDDENYVVDKMTADVVEGDSSPPITIIADPKASEPPAPVVVPITREVRKLNSSLIPADTPPPPILITPPEPVVDLKRQFDQFDNLAEEVIQGARFDRQETQDAINICRTEIQKSVGVGGQPMRMWVDNLIKALEVKATINLTSIKALEAKAKLLAATKAGINVQNNNLINNASMSTQADNSLVDLLNDNPLDQSGEDEF